MRLVPLALLAIAGCAATDRLAMQLDVGAVAVPSSVPLTVAPDCDDGPPCGDVFDAGGGARDGVAGRPSWGGGVAVLNGWRLLPRLHLDAGGAFEYAHVALSPIGAFPVPGTPGVSYSAPGRGADLVYIGAPVELRWTIASSWDLWAGVVPGFLVVSKQVFASSGGSSTLDDGGPDVLGRVGIERSFDSDSYGVGIFGQVDPAGVFDGAFLTFNWHLGVDPKRALP